MPRDFKAPVNVSPLIRFGRWSFLLLGVTYGATRHSYLQKKEDRTKESRHQKIAEREAKIAADKKKFAEAEISNLDVIFNPPKTVA
ncbi:ATP synthase subunit e, mitochondrial [Rhopalosiphum padi]|uniref:ATP synthase subunit e, mitochondrial n=1 Tax=Rhopalosiphum padi TaxID=40932 RepID=UPI00298DE691|nr:ATP synthase subunit e, mitochondrial [Rhopalosiphum padi]